LRATTPVRTDWGVHVCGVEGPASVAAAVALTEEDECKHRRRLEAFEDWRTVDQKESISYKRLADNCKVRNFLVYPGNAEGESKFR